MALIHIKREVPSPLTGACLSSHLGWAFYPLKFNPRISWTDIREVLSVWQIITSFAQVINHNVIDSMMIQYDETGWRLDICQPTDCLKIPFLLRKYFRICIIEHTHVYLISPTMEPSIVYDLQITIYKPQKSRSKIWWHNCFIYARVQTGLISMYSGCQSYIR